MKKPFIFLMLLLSLFMAKAQEKSEIMPLVENILQSSIDKDYASVINHTYPKLFESFPQEVVLEILETSLNNEEFIIEVLPTEFDIEVSEIKEIDDRKYALIHFNLKSSLRFHYYINSETDNFKKLIKELMPEAKVVFDRKTQSFIIHQRARSLAISDEFTQGTWKFLNVDEFDNKLLSLLLDQKILNAFDL